MSKSVLVAYATRYGSTKEVAEKIGQIFIQSEFDVDVLPCKKVDALEGYQFIIIGAPYYVGSMLKDCEKFLTEESRHSLPKIGCILCPWSDR